MLRIEASCQHLAVFFRPLLLALPSTPVVAVCDGAQGSPSQHTELYTARNGSEYAGDTRSYYQYGRLFTSHVSPAVQYLAYVIRSKSTPNASSWIHYWPALIAPATSSCFDCPALFADKLYSTMVREYCKYITSPLFPQSKFIRDGHLAIVNILTIIDWQVNLHHHHLSYHSPAHLDLHVMTHQPLQSHQQYLVPQQSRPQYPAKNDERAWLVVCHLTFCLCMCVHLSHCLIVSHLPQVIEPAFLLTSELCFWALMSRALCWVVEQQPSLLGIAHDQICET